MSREAATLAAVGLAALGEADGAVIAQLARAPATQLLAAVLDLEIGEVSRAAFPRPRLDSGWQQGAIGLLLRHAYLADHRSLRSALALLPATADPSDQDLVRRIRVHIAAELGELPMISDLLGATDLTPTERTRLLGVVAPTKAVDEALSGADATARELAGYLLLQMGATASARRLAEPAAPSPHNRASDLELLTNLDGQPEATLSRLIADRRSTSPAGRGVAHLGFRWTQMGRMIWAYQHSNGSADAGVIDTNAVAAAMADAAVFIPMASGNQLEWIDASTRAWTHDQARGFRSLERLANIILPASLLEVLPETRALVIDLPPELTRIPIECAPVQGGLMYEGCEVWRLPPVPCRSAPQTGHVDLLVRGPGIEDPLQIDVDEILLGEPPRPDSGLVDTVVYHGHGNAGGGRWNRTSPLHAAGALLDREGEEVISLNSSLPHTIEGLVAICCEGLGRRSRHDSGWEGITAQAFKANASWVISASWPVPDSSATADLAGDLARNLEKDGPASALSQLRDTARARGLHPAYWISWACVGTPGA